MSDDAIKRLQSNWSDELPRGWCEWNKEINIDGVDALMNQMCDIPHLDALTGRVDRNLGLVVSPPEEVERYVDEHANGTIDIPSYFSDFPDGEKEPVYSVEEGHRLRSAVVEAAMRLLNGGGRYRTSEYTLYDCLNTEPEQLPCPLIRDEVGCVMVAPVISPGDD
ncbi:hypothetical protein [Halosimplex halobium]|uniref:hypothetical protein n=1 Tax=Halosimplex halobium TaxID=3396618 RepID=UPI003F56F9CD